MKYKAYLCMKSFAHSFVALQCANVEHYCCFSILNARLCSYCFNAHPLK